MSSGLRDEYVSPAAIYPATRATLSSMLCDVEIDDVSLTSDCSDLVRETLKRDTGIKLRTLWSWVRGRKVNWAESTETGKGFMPTSMDKVAVDCLPVKTLDNNGAMVSSLP